MQETRCSMPRARYSRADRDQLSSPHNRCGAPLQSAAGAPRHSLSLARASCRSGRPDVRARSPQSPVPVRWPRPAPCAGRAGAPLAACLRLSVAWVASAPAASHGAWSTACGAPPPPAGGLGPGAGRVASAPALGANAGRSAPPWGSSPYSPGLGCLERVAEPPDTPHSIACVSPLYTG